MYLGNFFFQFPLYLIGEPEFPHVAEHIIVFTEQLHAERFRAGNTVFTIKDIDDLEYVADFYKNDAVGICFDPTTEGNRWTSNFSVTWELLRIAIELERLDPDGYA